MKPQGTAALGVWAPLLRLFHVLLRCNGYSSWRIVNVESGEVVEVLYNGYLKLVPLPVEHSAVTMADSVESKLSRVLVAEILDGDDWQAVASCRIGPGFWQRTLDGLRAANGGELRYTLTRMPSCEADHHRCTSYALREVVMRLAM